MAFDLLLSGMTDSEEIHRYIQELGLPLRHMAIKSGVVINYNFETLSGVCGVNAIPIVRGRIGENIYHLTLAIETNVPGFYTILESVYVVHCPELVTVGEPNKITVVRLEDHASVLAAIPHTPLTNNEATPQRSPTVKTVDFTKKK